MRRSGTLRLPGTKDELPYNLAMSVGQAADNFHLDPVPHVAGLVIEHAMLCRDNLGIVVQLCFEEHRQPGLYHMRSADDGALVASASETLYLYVSPTLSLELFRILQSTMRWLLNS